MANENVGTISAEMVLEVQQFIDSSRQIQSQIDEMTDDIKKSLQESERDSDQFSSTLSDNFDAVAGVATLVSGGIATAFLSMGGTALETEKVFRQFEAQTGKTKDEVDKFEEKIKETYLDNYGESVEDVANAYSTFSRELKTNESETQKLVTKAYQLQEIFGYEYPDTLRAVGSLVKNFGVTGAEAFDLITFLAQNSGDRAEDLLDTFDEYSPRFAEIGFSAKQMTAILSAGADAGVRNYDSIADSLKEFYILLSQGDSFETLSEIMKPAEAKRLIKGVQDGTISAGDSFATVVDALSNMDNEVKRNQAGVALFGSLWDEVGLKGFQAMAKASDGNIQFKGSLDKAQKSLYGNQTGMEQVSRKLEGITMMMGEHLAPVLLKILDYVSKAITKFLEFSKANPVLAKIISIGGLVVSTIGAIIGAVAFLMPIILNVIAVVSAIGTAIGATVTFFVELAAVIWAVISIVGSLIASFISLPVIIGIAIVALVTLIILNWELVKTKTIEIFTIVKDFLAQLWENIKVLASTFVTFLQTKWDEFVTKSKEKWNQFIEYMKTIPSKLLAMAKRIPFVIGYIIGRFIKFVFDMQQMMNNFWTVKFPELIVAGFNKIKTFITEIIPILIEKFAKFNIKLILMAIELTIKLVQKAIELRNKMIHWFQDMMIQTALKVASGIIQILKFFIDLPSKIREKIPSIKKSGQDLGENLKDGIKQKVNEIPELVKEAIKNSIANIVSFGSSAYQKMQKFGSDMWAGFKKGMGINSPSLIEKSLMAVGQASNEITSQVRGDFGKLSGMRQPEITKIAQQGSNSSSKSNITQNFNRPLVEINGPVAEGEGEKIGLTAYQQIQATKYKPQGV